MAMVSLYRGEYHANDIILTKKNNNIYGDVVGA